jgi:hypothetical protein
VLAPLLVSVLYGPLGLFTVLPFALLITAVMATPLFFLFRSRGWLKWWQVSLAGVLCGVLFATLFDSTSPERLDAFGLDDALNFGGVGTLMAIVFWWLGLYRNKNFPAVPAALPYGIFFDTHCPGGVLLHRSFNPTFASGRIIAVKGDAPSREVSVRLSSGLMIEASLSRDSRPSAVLMNQCWHLMNHWSTWHFKRVYSLMAPYGGGVDDC